eukprot:scaffold1012_cov124-Isochrysis_galbana.AAC.3
MAVPIFVPPCRCRSTVGPPPSLSLPARSHRPPAAMLPRVAPRAGERWLRPTGAVGARGRAVDVRAATVRGAWREAGRRQTNGERRGGQAIVRPLLARGEITGCPATGADVVLDAMHYMPRRERRLMISRFRGCVRPFLACRWLSAPSRERRLKRGDWSGEPSRSSANSKPPSPEGCGPGGLLPGSKAARSASTTSAARPPDRGARTYRRREGRPTGDGLGTSMPAAKPSGMLRTAPASFAGLFRQ